MIETPTLVDVVLLAVPRGRRNAVTIEQLRRSLGVPRREVEEALQTIADAGVQPLVASSSAPAGVWLAESAEEVEAYIERLRRRLATQALRIRGLRRVVQAMRQPSEQLTLLELVS